MANASSRSSTRPIRCPSAPTSEPVAAAAAGAARMFRGDPGCNSTRFVECLRPPELKVRTPAHTKHLGWYLEFVFRVAHPMCSSMFGKRAMLPSPTLSRKLATRIMAFFALRRIVSSRLTFRQ